MNRRRKALGEVVMGVVGWGQREGEGWREIRRRRRGKSQHREKEEDNEDKGKEEEIGALVVGERKVEVVKEVDFDYGKFTRGFGGSGSRSWWERRNKENENERIRSNTDGKVEDVCVEINWKQFFVQSVHSLIASDSSSGVGLAVETSWTVCYTWDTQTLERCLRRRHRRHRCDSFRHLLYDHRFLRWSSSWSIAAVHHRHCCCCCWTFSYLRFYHQPRRRQCRQSPPVAPPSDPSRSRAPVFDAAPAGGEWHRGSSSSTGSRTRCTASRFCFLPTREKAEIYFHCNFSSKQTSTYLMSNEKKVLVILQQTLLKGGHLFGGPDGVVWAVPRRVK